MRCLIITALSPVHRIMPYVKTYLVRLIAMEQVSELIMLECEKLRVLGANTVNIIALTVVKLALDKTRANAVDV